MPRDFKIGADPEFGFLEKGSGRFVSAGNFSFSDNALFGRDGGGYVLELRPLPSCDPLKVVANIHDIFTKKLVRTPKFYTYDWKAGSCISGNAIGGHIHFGTQGDINASTATANALSEYVGAICLLIEDRKEAKERREIGYGVRGCHRSQSYGFEYRTCSSWLTSPYISAAILCLAKTVVKHLLSLSEKGKLHTWPSRFTDQDFETVNTTKILANFPDMWREITKMELYQKYKIHIDLLYFLVKNELNWFPNNDMKESWGLVDMSRFEVSNVKLKSIWSRFENKSNAKYKSVRNRPWNTPLSTEIISNTR